MEERPHHRALHSVWSPDGGIHGSARQKRRRRTRSDGHSQEEEHRVRHVLLLLHVGDRVHPGILRKSDTATENFD